MKSKAIEAIRARERAKFARQVKSQKAKLDNVRQKVDAARVAIVESLPSTEDAA